MDILLKMQKKEKHLSLDGDMSMIVFSFIYYLMPRQKLARYTYMETEPYIIQWLVSKDVLFPDAEHIMLEVACGRGEYSLWFAPLAPDVLHVGIDQKWDRISLGMQRARAAWLDNVRFIYGIVHHAEQWFAPHSVDSIWIIHPDPRPRERDAKRRLTHPRFLTIFQNLLKTWGTVHLKTDDHALFDYSCEQFVAQWWTCERMTHDLYIDAPMLAEQHWVVTHYEKLGIEEGRTICYGVWKKG